MPQEAKTHPLDPKARTSWHPVAERAFDGFSERLAMRDHSRPTSREPQSTKAVAPPVTYPTPPPYLSKRTHNLVPTG